MAAITHCFERRICGLGQEHQRDAFICDTSPLAPPLAERLVDGATDLAPEFAADLLVLPNMNPAVDASIIDLIGDGLEARIAECHAWRGGTGEFNRMTIGPEDALQTSRAAPAAQACPDG